MQPQATSAEAQVWLSARGDLAIASTRMSVPQTEADRPLVVNAVAAPQFDVLLGTRFTCFTRTNVQILTQFHVLVARACVESCVLSVRVATEVLNILALLVLEYKF